MSLASRAALIRGVLAGRVPPRALAWGALNSWHRLLRTGNKRFEFDRFYAEHGDYWQTGTAERPQRRYQATLAAVLRWRRHADAALDLGCGPGEFARLLAPHFGAVTAIDASPEALRLARSAGTANLHYAIGDIRELRLGLSFDVIVCGGVLCYIEAKDAARAAQSIIGHLKADGVVVVSDCERDGLAAEAELRARLDRYTRIELPDGSGRVSVYNPVVRL